MMKFYVIPESDSSGSVFPDDWHEYEIEPWDLPPVGSDYEEAAEKWAEENDIDPPRIADGNTEEVLVVSEHDIKQNPGKNQKDLARKIGIWGEYEPVYYTTIRE